MYKVDLKFVEIFKISLWIHILEFVIEQDLYKKC